jgi:uncharacterized membrane protein YuzA (DUF378 family)
MKALHMVSWILLIIGGLNWGLEGLFKFDLVTYLLGSWPLLVSLIFILVGISAVIELFTHKQGCKTCDSKAPMSGTQM